MPKQNSPASSSNTATSPTQDAKIQKRKEKNRLSAQRSRDKQKVLMSRLKEDNVAKDQIISNLRTELLNARQEIQVLKQEISQLKTPETNHQNLESPLSVSNLQYFSIFNSPEDDNTLIELLDEEDKKLIFGDSSKNS